MIAKEGKEAVLTKTEWCLIPVVYLVGILLTRMALYFIVPRNNDMGIGKALQIIFFVWDNSYFEQLIHDEVVNESLRIVGPNTETNDVRVPLLNH